MFRSLLSIAVLIALAGIVFSQDTPSSRPTAPVIVHKSAGFVKDSKTIWIEASRHRKEGGEYDPALFLRWSVDKSDVRKSADGYDYFKTRIYFGFKDQDEFYELPETVYSGLGEKFYTHCLAYYKGSYYIAAYGLNESKKIDLVLYKFSKANGLRRSLVNSSSGGQMYPTLEFITQGVDNASAVDYKFFPRLSFYNTETNFNDTYVINDNFIDASGKLDAAFIVTKPEDLENLSGTDKTKESARIGYGLSSNPYYNHKTYLLEKNVVINRTPIATQFDLNGVRRLSTAILKESEKNGWRYLEDWYNRNATQLFFSYKTDKADFRTDSKGNKYYKTLLRFGFRDDPEFYEILEPYYLLFSDELNQKLYLDRPIDLDDFGLKPPAMMFSGEAFYIYIPDYKGDDNSESILITYKIGSGLAKKILFSGPTASTGWFAYFCETNENGLELRFSGNDDKKNVLATFQKDGQWITKAVDLNVSLGDQGKMYRAQVKPFFLLPKPVLYIEPTIDPEWRAFFFSLWPP